MNAYYTVSGNHYLINCPLCGTQLRISGDPLVRTDSSTVTPKVGIRCPECGKICLKPGDSITYGAIPAGAAGAQPRTQNSPEQPGNADVVMVERGTAEPDLAKELQALGRQLGDLNYQVSETNRRLSDLHNSVAQTGYDVDSIRKWVKFFGVLVVLALIIALLPVILGLAGVTCSLAEYFK